MRKHYTFKELDLYHKEVFIPGQLSPGLDGRYLRLSYSSVADQRAKRDDVPVQDWVTLRVDNVVEVGCIPGTYDIDTIVVREPFSADKDLLLSIAVDFQKGYGTVKMAWTHTPGKPHFSIPRNKYVTAPRPGFNPVFFEKLEAAV